MSADQQKPPSAISLKKAIIFALIPSLLLLILAYCGSCGHRSARIYYLLKLRQNGWQGKPFAYDAALGFAPVRSSQSVQLKGDIRVPVKFDHRGFRVPASEPPQYRLRRPMVLALGCSYTFGEGIAAEKTFVWLVAKEMNGTALNAGVPAYGLAQISLLGRGLIPQYRPDYVLIQYSDWMTIRGASPTAISYTGTLPVPFFAATAQNNLRLEPPLFRTRIFDLPIQRFQDSKLSGRDFLAFLREVGAPLMIYDDFQIALARGRLRLANDWRLISRPEVFGLIPPVYGDLEQLCVQNHAQMVVVILHDPMEEGLEFEQRPELKKLKQSIIVDSGPALLGPLPQKTREAFFQRYARTEGNPPKLIDPHPNELAHRIIAQTIIETLPQPPRR